MDLRFRLVCGNCGRREYFKSTESADAAGWDTVFRFGYNVCPEVGVYFPMLYAEQARIAETPEQRSALMRKAAPRHSNLTR